MNSKEALGSFIELTSLNFDEEIDAIKKDLEILEILKDIFNYKTIQKFVDKLTADEFFKIKEWLENE